MNNIRHEIAPSAQRTASFDVPIVNPDAWGIQVPIDITANPGGLGSITVTIQGVDKTSGKKYTLLASAALTAVATTVLRVAPGLAVAANLTASDMLPHDVNINITHNNANPITYSIGGQLCGA